MMTGVESQAQGIQINDTVKTASFNGVTRQFDSSEFSQIQKADSMMTATLLQAVGSQINTESMQSLAELEKSADTTLEYEQAAQKIVESFSVLQLDKMSPAERKQVQLAIVHSDLIKEIVFRSGGEEGLDVLEKFYGMSDLESHQRSDRETLEKNIQPLSQTTERVKFLQNLMNVIYLTTYSESE